MRISVLPDDPGYANWRPGYTGRVKILVDGQVVPADLVQTVDTDLGKVWAFKPGQSGGPHIDPETNEVERMVLEGRVEIVFEDCD